MIAYSERSTANVMSRLEQLVVVGKQDQGGGWFDFENE